MTMEGGEPPMDWAAFAPHIDHPARRSIVEALRRRGPLSASELGGVLDNPDARPAYVNYHAKVLVQGEVLTEVRQQSAGPSIENIYSFTAS
jgi:hypothetical protein